MAHQDPAELVKLAELIDMAHDVLLCFERGNEPITRATKVELVSALRLAARQDGGETWPDRKVLGQAIYDALYKHEGGRWKSNETQDVWFDAADRLVAILRTLEQ